MPDILVFDAENAIMTVKQQYIGNTATFLCVCKKNESLRKMD